MSGQKAGYVEFGAGGALYGVYASAGGCRTEECGVSASAADDVIGRHQRISNNDIIDFGWCEGRSSPWRVAFPPPLRGYLVMEFTLRRVAAALRSAE